MKKKQLHLFYFGLLYFQCQPLFFFSFLNIRNFIYSLLKKRNKVFILRSQPTSTPPVAKTATVRWSLTLSWYQVGMFVITAVLMLIFFFSIEKKNTSTTPLQCASLRELSGCGIYGFIFFGRKKISFVVLPCIQKPHQKFLMGLLYVAIHRAFSTFLFSTCHSFRYRYARDGPILYSLFFCGLAAGCSQWRLDQFFFKKLSFNCLTLTKGSSLGSASFVNAKN